MNQGRIQDVWFISTCTCLGAGIKKGRGTIPAPTLRPPLLLRVWHLFTFDNADVANVNCEGKVKLKRRRGWGFSILTQAVKK